MRSLLATLLTIAVAVTGSIAAQDPTPTPPPTPQGGPPTATAIQARLDAVTADDSLAAELKTSLTEVLGKALESARFAEQFAAAMSALPKPDDVDERLRVTRNDIEKEAGIDLSRVDFALPLDKAELELTKAQQEQTAAQAEIADLERESTRRTARRGEIPRRMVELRKLLDDLPAAAVTENADARLIEARRLRLRADRHRLETEMLAQQAEQQSYEAREQLLSARRDLAARRNNNNKALADAWQQAVQKLRSEAAAATQAAAQEAARQARDAHPLIRELAAYNQKIAAQLTPLIDKQVIVEARIGRAKELFEQVQAQYNDIKQRAEGAGSAQTLGSMLRAGRAKLPDVQRIFRRDGGRDDTTEADAYLASIDKEQERRKLADDTGYIEGRISALDPPVTDPLARDQLQARAQEMITLRLEMLKTLSDGWSKSLGSLQTLDATRQAVRELVTEYRAFVNERVLWIRSSLPIWRLNLQDASDACSWLTSPHAWWSAGNALLAAALDNVWPLLVLALLLLSLPLRRPWRQRLAIYRDIASRPTNTSYAPTALALLFTVLLALPIPTALWLLGTLLGQETDMSGFDKAMAVGAIHTAAFLMVLVFLREIVRPGGLAEAHFRWRPHTIGVLRSNLWLLLPAVFPLTTAIGALEKVGHDGWLGSLGRLLLLPLLGLMMVFLWRLLHPSTGVLGSGKERSILARFRRLWFLLAVGTTAALLVMTMLGYEYTVIQLMRSIIYTVAIVLGGALTHALILHKLMLERRRLSIQQSRERLAAAREAREQATDDGEEESDDPSEEQFALDPSSITEQTQAMVRTAVVLAVLFACLQVWSEVLPALGALRDVRLWTDDSVEPPIEITLVDLIRSLVIVLLTVIAARNIPGLLEMLVLRRLHVQAGERHATTTLARYVLVVVGTVMAFSAIGLGWSKVQWLIAALSLGLGFGLQEIFANFVSGLILLFERPVRVGDWVLVGDWLGKVTRIKIRATTVRDLDNKELVVPNKEFVTGRFVNWTLTDSLVRLRVPVGVAYGSDTQKAKELLVQAALDSPLSAESPAPRAMFLGFGDSSLNLELRVYVEDYQEHAPLMDDLHSRIDHMFRAAHIEIAFPQRDLHLRSARPLVEFLDRRDAEASDPQG